MAGPPFNINETSPAASALISSFPADEQDNRGRIEEWLTYISDPATGNIRPTVLPAASVTFDAGTKIVFAQTAAPTGWTKDVTHNNKALRLVNGTVSSGGSVAFTTAFASQAVAGTNANTTSTGTNANTTATGTVGSYTLTISDIPAHAHSFSGSGSTSTDGSHTHTVTTRTSGSGGSNLDRGNFNSGSASSSGIDAAGSHSHSVSVSGTTNNNGSGGGHSHSFTGTAHTHTITMNAHTHTFTGTSIDLTVQYVDVIIATKNA